MKEARKRQDKAIEFSIILVSLFWATATLGMAYRVTTLEAQVNKIEKQIQK
jgi:hypothetical protein